MKKYKIGKYIITANSPDEAVKVVKLIDSQINDAIKGTFLYEYNLDLDKLLRFWDGAEGLNRYDLIEVRKKLSAIKSGIRTHENEIAIMQKEVVKAKRLVEILERLEKRYGK